MLRYLRLWRRFVVIAFVNEAEYRGRIGEGTNVRVPLRSEIFQSLLALQGVIRVSVS